MSTNHTAADAPDIAAETLSRLLAAAPEQPVTETIQTR
jgi:CTP:molybdopterin cytidylyltransferase MocA